MRRMVVLSALALAGCATPAAYTELSAAQQALQQHDRADSFVNVDLLETAGTTEDQRAPEVKERKDRAHGCHEQFYQGFAATLNESWAQGPSGLTPALQRGQRLEVAYAECIRAFGLAGYPEFKVGDQFLRTDPFLRSYWRAGVREAQARQMVDQQTSSAGMAFAAGAGAAGRSAGSYYQPVPSVIPAPAPQVRCTSYRYGLYVNTSCQ